VTVPAHADQPMTARVPHSFVFPWAVESSPLQFLAL